MRIILYLVGHTESDALYNAEFFDDYTNAKRIAINEDASVYSINAEVDLDSIEFVRNFGYPIGR